MALLTEDRNAVFLDLTELHKRSGHVAVGVGAVIIDQLKPHGTK